MVVYKNRSNVTLTTKNKSLFLVMLFFFLLFLFFSRKVSMHAQRDCVVSGRTKQLIGTCIRKLLNESLCAIPGLSGFGYISCSAHFPNLRQVSSSTSVILESKLTIGLNCAFIDKKVGCPLGLCSSLRQG